MPVFRSQRISSEPRYGIRADLSVGKSDTDLNAGKSGIAHWKVGLSISGYTPCSAGAVQPTRSRRVGRDGNFLQ